MGTQRTIKSRINRFFEVGSTTQLDCSRGVNRWVKCSDIERNRLCAGLDVVRIDLTKGAVVV
jgi:hypothetical protein